MRRIVLAPCSPFSVTGGLMKETVRLARKYRVRLHTHLAETSDEDDYCLKAHGKRPLALMADWGFIGEDVSYAHGIFFNDEELKLLAETGTSVAHCPSSNMRLGSGIARVKEMLKLGVNAALGVDGSASNDTSDFLGEMRNALTVRDIFTMASENGARLLDFKKIGKIKEGWAADLALFNVNKLEYTGALSDPLAALLFAGSSHQTEYTIVDGRITVDRGRLTGFDEQEITRKANSLAFKLQALS